VVLGTIAAPGLVGAVTTRVAEELAEDLAGSYGAVGWRTVLEVDRLVEPPALTTDSQSSPCLLSARCTCAAVCTAPCSSS
jgi:hypothetical protein